MLKGGQHLSRSAPLCRTPLRLRQCRLKLANQNRGEEEMTLFGILLSQAGEKGNEAFLGLGVVAWIIIIAVVLAVAYFVSRRRAR
jgi:hypothetical protein